MGTLAVSFRYQRHRIFKIRIIGEIVILVTLGPLFRIFHSFSPRPKPIESYPNWWHITEQTAPRDILFEAMNHSNRVFKAIWRDHTIQLYTFCKFHKWKLGIFYLFFCFLLYYMRGFQVMGFLASRYFDFWKIDLRIFFSWEIYFWIKLALYRV